MNRKQSTLGVCPDCERNLPPAYVLIEYERDDGTEGMFAECPECGEVVKPV
jgi:predicted RNA-binding Zn-ribbon protein involved in translation (DUF1610 family)